MRGSVNSYILSSRDFLRLGTGVWFWSGMESAAWVDSLPGYTKEMFDILTDFLAAEYGINLPGTKRLIGSLCVDGATASVHCFTLDDVRTLRTKLAKVAHRWHEPPISDTRGSFFGYLLELEHHEQYEYNGIAYLGRQADHVTSKDDYLVIVGTRNSVKNSGVRIPKNSGDRNRFRWHR